jgi:CheY-like chemotaxis protein
MVTVLLVEDDPADAGQIQDALAGTGDNSTGENTFHVEWVMRLDDALERLDRERCSGTGQVDAGIAIGDGSDMAVETADVILVRSNPLDVVAIVELSRATYRKIIQNLVWATG